MCLRLGGDIYSAGTWALTNFSFFCILRLFLDANSMGFKVLKEMHAVNRMGFKRHPVKTHVNST